MVKWVHERNLPLTFLGTLAAGLALISVGAFLICAVAGFISTGCLLILAGHWVTYLRTVRGSEVR